MAETAAKGLRFTKITPSSPLSHLSPFFPPLLLPSPSSPLSSAVLTMIGLAEQEIATQQTHNEIHLNVEIISAIETMLAVSMAC